MLRILHLSDLHLSAAEDEVDAAREALVDTVSTLRQGGEGPDLLLVSGDLVERGGVAAYPAVARYLDRLRQAAGLSRRRIVLVPGNHDVERAAGRRLQRSAGSAEDAALFFADPAERALHARKLAAFHAFIDEFHGPGGDPAHRFPIGGLTVGVAALNSAWFSQGDDDRGKLWLGAEVAAALAAQLATCDVAIALCHHGPEWLHPDDAAGVLPALEAGFDLLCHGHLHGHAPPAENLGSCLVLAAGPCHRDPRYPTRVLRLAISPGPDGALAVQVVAMAHAPAAKRWQPDPTLHELYGPPGAPFPFPLRRRGAAAPRPPAPADDAGWLPADEEALRQGLQALLQEAQARPALVRHPQGGGPLPVLGLYAELPARVLGNGGPSGVSGLIGAHPRLLLLGGPAAGKSTTLLYAAAELARHALGQPAALPRFGFPQDLAPLPFPLDLSQGGDLDAAIEAQAAALGPGAPAGFARRLLRRGALLLIDNPPPLPSLPAVRDALAALCARHPAVRVVLVAGDGGGDRERIAALRDLFAPAGFTAARLAPLRSEDRTQLIDRFIQNVSALPADKTLYGPAAATDAAVRQAVNSERGAALATHPLLLSSLCWLAVRHGLPPQRAELYGACLGALVENCARPSAAEVGALIDEMAGRGDHDVLLGFRTAQVLAGRPDPWPAVRPLLDDPGSYEALRFLAGLLAQRSQEAASRLLRSLLSEGGGRMDPAERAQLIGLSAHLLAEMAPYAPDPKVAKRVQEDLGRLLDGLSDPVQGTPLPIRIAVAEGLGRAGDPRLPLDLMEPPGAAKDREPGRPGPWVELPAGGGFAAVGLLRYPLTCEQFFHFVRLSGYEPPPEEDGPRDVRALWAERTATQPNHPATLVSYDDALALCRFLTQADWRYRYDLPAEGEWERAVRQGSYDDRPYPWGAKMEPSYCNTGRRVGRTTPVGVFPAGTAALGAGCADLIGNVWEWCQGETDDPTMVDADADDGSGALALEVLSGGRVARGGSWNYTRTGVMRQIFPGTRSEEIGIRLVRRSK